MYFIKPSSTFNSDLNVCISRGYDISLLEYALKIMRRKGKLPKEYKTHLLKGTKYKDKGIFDSHIENDWLILYKIKENTVFLIRTGTHSDLFDK